MLFADQVPVNSTQMPWPMWGVLITRSTGTALVEVEPQPEESAPVVESTEVDLALANAHLDGIGISTLTALSSASAQKCPLPPGSYLASCQQCYVVYPICNTLTCNICFVGQNDIWGKSRVEA
jgi:hypothetical protein